MEKIIYQGQSIEAQRVNYQSNHLAVALLPDNFELAHQGKEELYRDDQGCYYLRRALSLLDVGSENERNASGRTLVHRISTKAAILWTTVRANAETYHLRRDARASLAAPASPNAVRQFADGSMAVTLHLKPEPARLFRVACEMNRRDPLAELYAALKCSVVDDVSAWDNRKECQAAFDDNAPQAAKALGCDSHRLRLVDGDGTILDELTLNRDLFTAIQKRRVTCQCVWADAIGYLLERGVATFTDAYRTVQLNDKVVALLERFQRQNDSETWDIINGAAISMLECSLGNGAGPDFGEAIEEATNLRHGITFYEDDEDEETMTLNLTTEEDGTVDAVEIPRSLYDEIERQAKARGHDFATYFVEMVREVVGKKPLTATKMIGHMLTLHLTKAQAGMLQQAAKYDLQTIDHWVMQVIGNNVAACLGDEGDHNECRVERAWNKVRLNPIAAFEAPLPDPKDAILDERALELVQRFSGDWECKAADVVNGTLHFCLESEYGIQKSRSLLETIDAIAGRRLGLNMERRTSPTQSFRLDEHTCGLLSEYLADHPNIDPRDVVNGAMDFLLSDPHDDGPESSSEALANAQVRRLGDTDGNDEVAHHSATGRRPAGDPADVALLAAADPSADDDGDGRQQTPTPPMGKRKRGKNGKEGK